MRANTTKSEVPAAKPGKDLPQVAVLSPVQSMEQKPEAVATTKSPAVRRLLTVRPEDSPRLYLESGHHHQANHKSDQALEDPTHHPEILCALGPPVAVAKRFLQPRQSVIDYLPKG